MKRYLRFYKPDSPEKLDHILNLIVKDYMYHRPHGTLKGLTPFIAYTTAPVSLEFSPAIAQARTARIAQNKARKCNKCS